MEQRSGDRRLSSSARVRMAGWGAAGALLLLPVVARAPWTLSDFVFAGALLAGAGLVMEVALRASGDAAYRAGAALATAAAVLLVWVNGAVGFLGSEDNPANLMFFGVLVLAAVGSVLARFRPAGMARAMFATAAAQVLAGVVGLSAGLGSPGYDGLHEAVMGTALFSALWFVSAGLFRKSAERAAPAP